MTVRFYVDADTLGLAHIMVRLRGDVTYPGDKGGVTPNKSLRPPCIVERTKVPDEEWIPIVAKQGWAIITRDATILRRENELDMVRDHEARLFTIISDEQLNNWGMLEIVVSQWRFIEKHFNDSGPFVWTMTRTSTTQASLDAEVNRVRWRNRQQTKPARRAAAQKRLNQTSLDLGSA